MKKIFKILLCFVLVISLTGCGTSPLVEKDLNAPANLKEITGEIVKAEFDDDGRIIIHKSDITEEVRYISYEYEGIIIGLLAVRDSAGVVHVVINTCQSCGGTPYAYFVQVGEGIQCQNCGSIFPIDDLGNLSLGGCNPISIDDIIEDDDIITIGTEPLNNLKDKFENLKGPKKKER